MTRYAALERHMPSLAPYLAWWLDGLSHDVRARGPGKAARLSMTDLAQAPSRPVALEVPQQDWLTLTLSLPPVSREAQSGIVTLAVADKTPFDPDMLHLDWSHEGRVHLVRKASVAPAIQEVATAGGRVRWLVPDGDTSAFIDLSPPVRRPLKRATIALVSVLLLLLATGIYRGQDIAHLRDIKADAAQQLETTRQVADAARTAAREIDVLRAAETTRLPQTLLPQRPPPHVLLEWLTAATPDHTFLTALEITETEALLSGWSTEPEALMRALDAHEGLTNPRFQGPVVSGEDGFRFEIRLNWKKQV